VTVATRLDRLLTKVTISLLVPGLVTLIGVEKSMYGKAYMGIERSTFVIDALGNVAKIMRRVKPAEHADDVLAALS
jgi:peroxiredoxin